MSAPRFSVVVPSRNRPDALAACLEALVELDDPGGGFEVIVVDDGSRAPIESVARAFRDRLPLRVVRLPGRGPAAARNAGIEIAVGKYVAFTADDCLPQRDWLSALAARFAADPAAGVGGRIENQLPHNVYSTSTDLLLRRLYDYHNQPPERARFFTPNNLAFPLAPLREVGGFLDALETGEDRELCDRWRGAGRRLVYAAEAVVGHVHPLGFASFLHLHYRYGKGSSGFRREAARRGSEAARFEPVSFYLELIRYPLSVYRGARGLTLSGLMCVAQVANAVGYLRQSLARPGSAGRAP